MTATTTGSPRNVVRTWDHKVLVMSGARTEMSVKRHPLLPIVSCRDMSSDPMTKRVTVLLIHLRLLISHKLKIKF